MKLVIYRTFGKVGGGYRWRLVADNGRTLANGGQGYSRRIDMWAAIEQVIGGVSHSLGHISRPTDEVGGGYGRDIIPVEARTKDGR